MVRFAGFRRQAAVLTAGALSIALSSGQTYHLTDLGTPGVTSYANGINSWGEVVGMNENHAFFYDGTMHDIGTLGSGLASAANGINDDDLIVGYSTFEVGNSDTHAFRYDGSLHDLGTLPGSNSSVAYGVNAGGLVVGNSDSRAFLYDGTMHDLGTFGDRASGAGAVNSDGKVVGWAENSSGRFHAFLYDGVRHDIGSSFDGDTTASAISDSGLIVGDALSGGVDLAATFENGEVHTLGTLGGPSSSAADVNGSGLIVGTSFTAHQGSHAFLYEGSTMLDLNDLLDTSLPEGWKLREANAINSNGWIVGDIADDVTGEVHAVLLTPVPEPTSLIALGLGTLLTWASVRRGNSR
ncbi:MAG TPA: PEP-CTERM sorting domain-containing protein [Fimbriimonadaceae bacterium]|nr:PEP-CTERM sorting domain-containing protein [Fimbriimonadaceae bacterium]